MTCIQICLINLVKFLTSRLLWSIFAGLHIIPPSARQYTSSSTLLSSSTQPHDIQHIKSIDENTIELLLTTRFYGKITPLGCKQLHRASPKAPEHRTASQITTQDPEIIDAILGRDESVIMRGTDIYIKSGRKSSDNSQSWYERWR